MELIKRMELEIPKQGNQFLKIPQVLDQKHPCEISLRVSSGRSFLSGNDVVFFDGTMSLEFRATKNNRKIHLNPFEIAVLLQRARRVLKSNNLNWDLKTQSIELDLIEDVTISVDQSSIKILKKLAKEFNLRPLDLTKQANWILKSY